MKKAALVVSAKGEAFCFDPWTCAVTRHYYAPYRNADKKSSVGGFESPSSAMSYYQDLESREIITKEAFEKISAQILLDDPKAVNSIPYLGAAITGNPPFSNRDAAVEYEKTHNTKKTAAAASGSSSSSGDDSSAAASPKKSSKKNKAARSMTITTLKDDGLPLEQADVKRVDDGADVSLPAGAKIDTVAFVSKKGKDAVLVGKRAQKGAEPNKTVLGMYPETKMTQFSGPVWVLKRTDHQTAPAPAAAPAAKQTDTEPIDSEDDDFVMPVVAEKPKKQQQQSSRKRKQEATTPSPVLKRPRAIKAN